MKKLIASLLAVVTVVGAVAVGTRAYFTDTETSIGNTFTTGTIEMNVDGNSIWNKKFALTDMKPSYTDYIDFVVKNEGTNPFNLYKTLQGYFAENVLCTEPEMELDSQCTINDIHNWINYDMRVELYSVDPTTTTGAQPIWWETIYLDSQNVKMAALENKPMFLGMVPVGYYMKVMQSYHMVSDTSNAYQGDRLTFDISLEAQQLGQSTLVLENKEEVNGDLSHTILGDGKYADLTYKVKDRELAFTFNVYGWTDGTYSLVAWEDASMTWPWANRDDARKLADVTVSGGTATVTDSVELGEDLTNAKVWLIPGTFVEGDASTFPWNPVATLFETGLMDYYDADL